MERLEKRKQKGVKEKKKSTTPKLTQEECLGQLRQFVGLAPIAGIQKRTLVNITRVTSNYVTRKMTTLVVRSEELLPKG